jgi:hypothetical protein
MKIDLTVKLIEGEPVDITARFADFVAFERTWNRSVAKLETDTRLTDIAWLAWHVMKRTRLTTLAFDPDWINTVDEVAITAGDGDDFLDETQPTG